MSTPTTKRTPHEQRDDRSVRPGRLSIVEESYWPRVPARRADVGLASRHVPQQVATGFVTVTSCLDGSTDVGCRDPERGGCHAAATPRTMLTPLCVGTPSAGSIDTSTIGYMAGSTPDGMA